MRLPRDLLLGALLRPASLLSFLVFVAALAFLLTSRGGQAQPPQPVRIGTTVQDDLEPSEIRLITYDAEGLETPVFRNVALPEDRAERLEAILGALREAMPAGAWPEALPVPNVFVENVERRAVAILDLRPEAPIALDVAGEARLLRSVEATLLANGVEEVRYLLGGEAAGVFLEHLAVPAGL